MSAGVALLMVMLFSFIDAGAQPVTDTLKEVKVKSRRAKAKVSNDERINTFSPGQQIKSFDSITLQQYQFQNVAQLLAQQVPVFVRSYGLNGVATLNFRGASAAQSQVLWNGVPIQNAALGIADVSLLPVSLMNKVNIVYGSSAALWGSGNVGGALLVENDLPAFDSNERAAHSVSAVAGSYQQYRLGVKSSMASRRFAGVVQAFGQSARNDFSYTDQNSREQRMNNSQLRSGVGLVQAGYLLNDKNTLNFIGWYQQYNRDIPPALFESSSVKNQRDESIRLLLQWSRTSKSRMHAKAAFIRDNMRFEDNSISLYTNNTVHQFYGEYGIKFSPGAHQQLLVFTPIQINWMKQRITDSPVLQKRVALAASYVLGLLDERWLVALNAREELFDNKLVFLPGFNTSFAVTNWLSVRANVQYTYRLPTLNELYYEPGGNKDLQPESGWSQDGGYVVKLSVTKDILLQHSLSMFNRHIKDWIIWFGGAIWTPHNIATVHSRGVETENMLSWKRGKWTVYLGLNTAYILATTTQSYIPNDGSIDKQIPYTPRYNGQANFGLGYGSLHFNYNHTYTGYRFITTDESQYILPYNTGNVQLLYTLPLKDNSLQLSVQANNIWSRRYEVVAARPMPRINYLAGVNFNFAP